MKAFKKRQKNDCAKGVIKTMKAEDRIRERKGYRRVGEGVRSRKEHHLAQQERM